MFEFDLPAGMFPTVKLSVSVDMNCLGIFPAARAKEVVLHQYFKLHDKLGKKIMLGC